MAKYTDFYRCTACHRVIEMNEHLANGNAKCFCGGSRFTRTMLTRFEAGKYLITHPAVVWETIKGKLKESKLCRRLQK